jgi:hypothetical protein
MLGAMLTSHKHHRSGCFTEQHSASPHIKGLVIALRHGSYSGMCDSLRRGYDIHGYHDGDVDASAIQQGGSDAKRV